MAPKFDSNLRHSVIYYTIWLINFCNFVFSSISMIKSNTWKQSAILSTCDALSMFLFLLRLLGRKGKKINNERVTSNHCRLCENDEKKRYMRLYNFNLIIIIRVFCSFCSQFTLTHETHDLFYWHSINVTYSFVPFWLWLLLLLQICFLSTYFALTFTIPSFKFKYTIWISI